MNFFKLGLKWSESHPARAAVLAGWYQQGCGILSSIVVIPIILKLLGPGEAGLWFSLQGFLAMVGLADFGFSMAISRQVAHSLRFDKEQYSGSSRDLIETRPGWEGVSELYASSRVIFWRVTALAAVILVFLHEAVLPFTRLFETHSAHTTLVWYSLSVSILFAFQTRLSQSFLDGIGFMFLGRAVGGTYALLSNLASAVALVLAPGLLSMSLALLAVSAFQFFAMHLLLSRFAGREMNFRPPVSKALIARLWKVALPFGFVNSGVYLITTAQVPLVGLILGPAAVAPYYLAARIIQTLGAGAHQVTITQMPLFTQECAAGKLRGAKLRVDRTMRIAILLYIMGSLFFYFGSPFLVKLWVGAGQYVGRDVLLFFAINFLIGGVTVVPAHFVLASGSNPFPIAILTQGVLTIAGVIIFCPIIGIVAMPLCSLVAGLCTTYWYNLLKGWQLWRLLDAVPPNPALPLSETTAVELDLPRK